MLNYCSSASHCCTRSGWTTRTAQIFSKVSFFKRLQNITDEAFDDELDKIFPICQSAFREPHDDHVMGQEVSVVVELEQVGVGEGDGEHELERLT